MKAKQEDVVKERERQLAKIDAEKQLQQKKEERRKKKRKQQQVTENKMTFYNVQDSTVPVQPW